MDRMGVSELNKQDSIQNNDANYFESVVVDDTRDDSYFTRLSADESFDRLSNLYLFETPETPVLVYFNF